MNEIHIQPLSGLTVPEMDVEIVERKGLGHPDTICDAVMERIARVLSKAYQERFGALLHFSCDKGLLVAGRVQRRFGGGQVRELMRLVIGDRATTTWKKKRLDVAEVAVETAKAWFRENLPRVDPVAICATKWNSGRDQKSCPLFFRKRRRCWEQMTPRRR